MVEKAACKLLIIGGPDRDRTDDLFHAMLRVPLYKDRLG